MANFKNKQNADILNSVYRNAQMAFESTSDVLKHCRNNALGREISRQQRRYKTVASRARRELARLGEPAKEASPYVKSMAKMGIAMKTAANQSSSNLAQIMLRGTTMGIIDMQRTVNRSHAADPFMRHSAERLLEREQNFCEDLKRYL
ncbi:MAG: hypothetical protein K2N56_03650 [Oscillospiraceae bacterium]|nr:hypothetical protein [Oscillospiraceae bacterium]